MSAPVDVLAVMDRAIESAGLMVKASGDMRAVAYQDDLFKARAAVAELIEAANHAHMALIGYLPAHRNDVTDAAIEKISSALARVGGAA